MSLISNYLFGKRGESVYEESNGTLEHYFGDELIIKNLCVRYDSKDKNSSKILNSKSMTFNISLLSETIKEGGKEVKKNTSEKEIVVENNSIPKKYEQPISSSPSSPEILSKVQTSKKNVNNNEDHLISWNSTYLLPLNQTPEERAKRILKKTKNPQQKENILLKIEVNNNKKLSFHYLININSGHRHFIKQDLLSSTFYFSLDFVFSNFKSRNESFQKLVSFAVEEEWKNTLCRHPLILNVFQFLEFSELFPFFFIMNRSFYSSVMIPFKHQMFNTFERKIKILQIINKKFSVSSSSSASFILSFKTFPLSLYLMGEKKKNEEESTESTEKKNQQQQEMMLFKNELFKILILSFHHQQQQQLQQKEKEKEKEKKKGKDDDFCFVEEILKKNDFYYGTLILENLILKTFENLNKIKFEFYLTLNLFEKLIFLKEEQEEFCFIKYCTLQTQKKIFLLLFDFLLNEHKMKLDLKNQISVSSVSHTEQQQKQQQDESSSSSLTTNQEFEIVMFIINKLSRVFFSFVPVLLNHFKKQEDKKEEEEEKESSTEINAFEEKIVFGFYSFLFSLLKKPKEQHYQNLNENDNLILLKVIENIKLFYSTEKKEELKKKKKWIDPLIYENFLCDRSILRTNLFFVEFLQNFLVAQNLKHFLFFYFSFLVEEKTKRGKEHENFLSFYLMSPTKNKKHEKTKNKKTRILVQFLIRNFFFYLILKLKKNFREEEKVGEKVQKVDFVQKKKKKKIENFEEFFKIILNLFKNCLIFFLCDDEDYENEEYSQEAKKNEKKDFDVFLAQIKKFHILVVNYFEEEKKKAKKDNTEIIEDPHYTEKKVYSYFESIIFLLFEIKRKKKNGFILIQKNKNISLLDEVLCSLTNEQVSMSLFLWNVNEETKERNEQVSNLMLESNKKQDQKINEITNSVQTVQHTLSTEMNKLHQYQQRIVQDLKVREKSLKEEKLRQEKTRQKEEESKDKKIQSYIQKYVEKRIKEAKVQQQKEFQQQIQALNKQIKVQKKEIEELKKEKEQHFKRFHSSESFYYKNKKNKNNEKNKKKSKQEKQ